MDIEYRKLQIELCNKYGAEFFNTPMNFFIGFANESFEKRPKPINGIRHPIQKPGVSSWYLWAGQDFSEAEDFFKPVHIEHLINICPKAIAYLGLPPGWRFLYDGDYEDVWFDENLLKI